MAQVKLAQRQNKKKWHTFNIRAPVPFLPNDVSIQHTMNKALASRK